MKRGTIGVAIARGDFATALDAYEQAKVVPYVGLGGAGLDGLF